MNNVQLKANIDAGITNKTANNSVTPPIVGGQLKDIVDYIDQEVDAVALVSQQVNVSTGTNPEIKFIDYVRIFATADYQTCKLSGPHAVGKEIYIKNTTLFYVIVNGVTENINGNSSLTLPPNTYWHILKEDGGTNSITAFKLSLT